MTMRRRGVAIVIALALWAGEGVMADEFLKIGDRAPDFTIAASGGRTVSLAELRKDHAVVLVFLRGFG
jgi:peroxiredoxin